jgi:predicted HAD superfamily Cof-like phosphohydrolase
MVNYSYSPNLAKELLRETNFLLVEQFMKSFGQEVKDKPEWPDAETMDLRIDLIAEELEEFKDAIISADGTLVDVADALSDLLYVVYGAGHSFGIDLDKCFTEVHRSNMSKLDEDGNPIYREDGKVLKGPNFTEPNLKEIVK